ncbi:sigma factor [Porphyromonas macacae]|uniref:sigma factor n=1 Tax=Porphyromonas macacae TaxID=28115 RepID=UPI0004683CA2
MLSEKQFLDSFMPHRYLVEILCKQIFEDEDMAKDSVQDIYLKLWQQRDSLDELQNPKAYLLRTARNHCLDELRKSIAMVKSNRSVMKYCRLFLQEKRMWKKNWC